MNRNAKSPAFAAELPEVTYGELAGWGQSGDVTRQVLTLIELRHGGDSQRSADLFAAVTAATDEVMADVLSVEATGHDDLTRFFDLALIGQLVSLHLAAQEGVDPGPTPALDGAHAGAALPSAAKESASSSSDAARLRSHSVGSQRIQSTPLVAPL